MKKQIRNLLEQIEKDNNIKILFAVENGSRAWAMASQDSDYDVRFVYYRKTKAYLNLDKFDDVINIAFDENLNQCKAKGSLIDISGFDIYKYLKLLLASNPTALEWLNSPIKYLGNNNLSIRKYMCKNFNPERLYKHYFSIFQNNYNEYIVKEKMITYKKYLYSMRGLLNAKYVYIYDKLPPLSFKDTVNKLQNYIPETIYNKLLEIIEIKSKGLEKDTILRIPEFDEYFNKELQNPCQNFLSRKPDVKVFNKFLYKILKININPLGIIKFIIISLITAFTIFCCYLCTLGALLSFFDIIS